MVLHGLQEFFHRTGYFEDGSQQLRDFEFLFTDRENHYAIQSQLALELLTLVPGAQSLLEIGHGAGFFLKAFVDYGLSSTGFEVNPHCHRFAVDHLEKYRADVFAHNDVHITNFSIEGMKRMGIGLRARSAEYFVSKDVYHNSPGAYQGVLFRF